MRNGIKPDRFEDALLDHGAQFGTEERTPYRLGLPQWLYRPKVDAGRFRSRVANTDRFKNPFDQMLLRFPADFNAAWNTNGHSDGPHAPSGNLHFEFRLNDLSLRQRQMKILDHPETIGSTKQQL